MLARIRHLFRSDAYIPSAAVFPSIDAQLISRTLRLEEVGKTRGQQNQPAPNATGFDHVESGIIAEIEELRRKGLDNYETNRRIYNERLARAGQASKEVAIAAGQARNDFAATAHQWQSQIVAARERLNESYRWRNRFREIHGLERPAVNFIGWTNVIAMAVILIVLEAALNSYLFSKGNEFGLLGGLFAAVIVSLVNVSGSLLLGYLSRYMRHRLFLAKISGLLVLAIWFAFAAALNLGVGKKPATVRQPAPQAAGPTATGSSATAAVHRPW
ncbi:hypothetical protein [uncultured Paracoccus sp.]|uniref:hypothetical protein n=1 Tax=uncultured Paracoccus sp. TaxID=189685 RepID=UPI0026030B76|nr:hypothetical protein [uncultured Paracoccus sp.]